MEHKAGTKQLSVGFNPNVIHLLGKKMYSSGLFDVVLRELWQNAIDANSTKIETVFSGNTLTVTDNGDGIQSIEGLLNIVGESYKNCENESAIGGYGLAKLAIFGTEYWKFTSISGSFSTGFILDESDKLEKGTSVMVQFAENDLPWNYDTKINDGSKLINRDIDFYFNGNYIEKNNGNFLEFPPYSLESANSYHNGCVLVRVNGLPTFRRWISGLNCTLIKDFTVTVNPYDPSYPLTSNRDNFIESSGEFKELEHIIYMVSEKIKTDEIKETNDRLAVNKVLWRGKTYWTSGKVHTSDFSTYSSTFYTFSRYLNQIHALITYEEKDFRFGLMGGDKNEIAMFDAENEVFFIQSKLLEKGIILTAVIHEYVHFLGYANHNESFSSKLTEINGTVYQALFTNQFRK